jgi:probable F420-dependent oxidoreductase
MNYWLYLNEMPEEQLVEIARIAERVGFRGVALADHIVVPTTFDRTRHPSGQAPFDHTSSFPDPLITAATILASTDRLEVMSYVYILPMRDPFAVAKQVGTLARLSAGRFRFGIGAGWMLEEIELIGHAPAARGRRMDEMLSVMRGFWTQESFEFHGEFFDFAPAGMAPRPRAPVPIWVGGKSRVALERAARHDGWLGMNYDLPEVHSLLSDLEALRAGRDDADPWTVFVIPNAAPSPELHLDLAARGVTDMLGFAFPVEDPAFASIEAKQEALERFAEVFIRA